MKIEIGHLVEENHSPVTLDIDALVYSKALLQANSGGGKSGLIRVVVEKTIPHIPTIIIDPEGEFSTLREKFDIVLVGEQGELEADPRSAGLLARKLVELGASAVLDIYELKPDAKHQFVKAFLESLMALPRKLWRPTFIVIDEAQMFAPEKGMGESDAGDAVADLQFRGRKRGFGTILATPRLSMLHKNVAGANNIFIGRTNLDTDQKRCGKALGKSDKEAIELRVLKPRQFYCYGPDLNVDGVTLFHVADCQTTIRKPGDRKSLKPPKASHVVEQLADQMKDIKQEAEKEIRDLNEAKAEIASLNRKLKAAESGRVPREQDTQRIKELEAALEKALLTKREVKSTVEKKIIVAGDLTRIENEGDRVAVLLRESRAHAAALEQLHDKISATIAEAKALNAQQLQVAPDRGDYLSINRAQAPTIRAPAVNVSKARESTGARSIATTNGDLPGVQQKVLDALAELEALGMSQPPVEQVAFMAGYSNIASKSFANARGALRSAGMLDYPTAGAMQLTDIGRGQAAQVAVPISVEELQSRIIDLLGGTIAKVVKESIKVYPDALPVDELARRCGYENIASKSFANARGRARTLGLITYPASGTVKAASILFME